MSNCSDLCCNLPDDCKENKENNDRSYSNFTIINTNARSLCPKIRSLLDCFEDMSVDLAFVTETWMTEGDTLLEDIEDLSLGSGIGMISRCRPAGGRGFSHGGVAVAFKESTCTFKHLKNHNPEGYEVLAAIGNLPGHTRKMIAIACYMPPGDCAARGKGCLEYIQNLVIKYKRKYKEPYLVVAGDFNQWKVHEALEDFIDIKEVPVGDTRGNHCIDRTFTNLMDSVQEAGTLPPLKPTTAVLATTKSLTLSVKSRGQRNYSGSRTVTGFIIKNQRISSRNGSLCTTGLRSLEPRAAMPKLRHIKARSRTP